MARKFGVSAHNLAGRLATIVLITAAFPSNAGVAFFARMAPAVTSVNYDFTASGASLPFQLTLTRATTATYVNSSGLIATAATNTARIDFDPTTLAQKGLLMEPAATNQIRYNQDMTNAVWTVDSLNLSTVTSPDGTSNANFLQENTANNVHKIYQDPVSSTAGNTVTISAFIKNSGKQKMRFQVMDATAYSNGITMNIDLSTNSINSISAYGNGSLNSSSVTAYPSGWYRYTMTGVVSTTQANALVQFELLNNSWSAPYTGDGSSGIYVWGTQFEIGTRASSVIPTTSAAVTRNADQVTFNTMTWFNQPAGTLLAQFIDIGSYSGLNYRVFSLSNTNAGGTFAQNEIFIGDNGTTNTSGVTTASSAVFAPAGAVAAAGSVNKIALSYQANNFAYSINGGAAITDTSGALPSPAYGYIGSQPDGNMRPRWIQKIRYWPNTTSSAALAAISTP
ncbi:MAG: hypothetical protein AB7F86_14555 [Bdellovibrionales bacterium]